MCLEEEKKEYKVILHPCWCFPSHQVTQLHMPMSLQLNAMDPYSLHSNGGYGRMNLAAMGQEKLPSDLDDMLIESLDCDMESIIRNDLMDGDTLDFNFDCYSTSSKTSTHNWVSG